MESFLTLNQLYFIQQLFISLLLHAEYRNMVRIQYIFAK